MTKRLLRVTSPSGKIHAIHVAGETNGVLYAVCGVSFASVPQAYDGMDADTHVTCRRCQRVLDGTWGVN